MGEEEKLALIVNTASYNRVSFALDVAIAAAAVGRGAAMLFGYGALLRLKKGNVDEVGDETEAWLREQIRSGLEKGSVPRISEQLETFWKLGGKVYACPAAMALHNLIKDELLEGVSEVCSVAGFLSRDAKDASTILYV